MEATKVVAPGRIPVLGNFLSFARQPLEYLTSLPNYGDLVEVAFGSRRLLVVCHPDLVHQVLRDGRVFDKGGPFFQRVRLVLGNGLGTCPYEDHRRQRRRLQPMFTRDRLAKYSVEMSAQIDTELQSWRSGQVIDVLATFNKVAGQITAQTMFGASLTPQEISDLQCYITEIVNGAFQRMFTPPGLRWVPNSGSRRFTRAIKFLDQLVLRIIESYPVAGADRDDILSMLLDSYGREDGTFDDQEIRDQISTFIVAGTETTSALLSWALHLLAQYPEVEERLHAEVDSVLNGRIATWADVSRLQYTRQVLNETLRLCPPVWLVTRIVAEDTHLGGQPIPAGTPLLVSQYLLHHRADFFPNPERFDPDRWLPDQPTPQPGACVPFGGGARICLGEAFSMLESTLILASIANRWYLDSVSGSTVRSLPRASLRPHPPRMRLRPRHVSASAISHGCRKPVSC